MIHTIFFMCEVMRHQMRQCRVYETQACNYFS